MARTPPSVEVVVPTWNGADRLAHALEALACQTMAAGTCVVDNGSTDHTRAVVAAFPRVRYLRLASNVGFGAAVNRALASSDADVVILLNDDAVADPDFVAEAVRVQSASGAEMVAGCLRGLDGSVETVGVQIDQSLIAYDYLQGTAYADIRDRRLAPPLAPSGGAAIFTRSALLEVGGFDEAIFAYLEDAELGLRMRARGFKCVAAPKAFAWHQHSAALGGASAAKNELLGWGREYILWKHGASLGTMGRVRGRAIDLLIALGKAAIDRNLGVVRGAMRARRELRARTQGSSECLPAGALVELPLREAVRRRLRRRELT